LEIVKLRLDFSETSDKAATEVALTTLVQVFECALRLLSPFMPFITEELWNAVYDGNPPAKSIALTRYPQATDALDESDSELRDASLNQMKQLQRAITSIRALRKEVGVPDKEHVGRVHFHSNSGESVEGARPLMAALQYPDIVGSLARVSEVVDSGPLTQRHIHSESNFDVGFDYEAIIDVPAERERLTKDIARYEKGLAAAERQLGNEGFLAKAPAQIVEGLKKQEAETRLLLEKAQAALAALPKS
jgi:valyl-tRNA synthetase